MSHPWVWVLHLHREGGHTSGGTQVLRPQFRCSTCEGSQVRAGSGRGHSGTDASDWCWGAAPPGSGVQWYRGHRNGGEVMGAHGTGATCGAQVLHPQVWELHLHRGWRGHTPGKRQGDRGKVWEHFTCPGGGGTGGTGGMGEWGHPAGFGAPRGVGSTQGWQGHRAVSGAFGDTRCASNTQKDLGTPGDACQDVWIAQGCWVHPAGPGGTQEHWEHRTGHRVGTPITVLGHQGCCRHSQRLGGTQGHWGHRAGLGVLEDTQGHPSGCWGHSTVPGPPEIWGHPGLPGPRTMDGCTHQDLGTPRGVGDTELDQEHLGQPGA